MARAPVAWPWDGQASSYYLSVQALRGVAVILVVAFHAKTAQLHNVWLYLPVIEDYGWVGVRLFFVISGFIIADRIGGSASLKDFYLRRYFRVFPLYALATLAALFIAHQHGGPLYTSPVTESGRPFDPGRFYIIKSLFIIPQDAWPYLNVGWSLEYEIVFYAVFGALFFTLGGRLAIAAFVPLGFALWYFNGFGLLANLAFFLYFSCGVAARLWLSLNPKPIWPALVAISGLGAAVYEMEFAALTHDFVLFTALGFMGLVVWVIQLERSGGLFQTRSPLVVVGDMSFSLYLTHMLFIALASVPLRGVELTPAQSDVIRLTFICVSLGLGYLTWLCVETPLRRVTKGALRWSAGDTQRVAGAERQ